MTQEELQKKIAERFGLAELSQEDQEMMIEKIMSSVMRRVLVVAGGKLSETDQQAFAEIIDSEPEPHAVDAFFLEKLTDYPQIIEDAITEIAEALQNVKS